MEHPQMDKPKRSGFYNLLLKINRKCIISEKFPPYISRLYFNS